MKDKMNLSRGRDRDRTARQVIQNLFKSQKYSHLISDVHTKYKKFCFSHSLTFFFGGQHDLYLIYFSDANQLIN